MEYRHRINGANDDWCADYTSIFMGLVIEPQPDSDWPIDDMDVKFPALEPEVIDLVSDDEAINGIYRIKNIMIVSDYAD